MRRLTWLAWVRLGFIGCVAASIGPACSDGEQQHATDGSGGSGAGGTESSNTSGGTSSTSTTGSGATNTGLGAECEVDSDCPTGLSCLTSGSNSLTEGGPSHGFCTFACGEAELSALEADEECQAFDANSLCQFFTETRAYCVPLCTLGGPAPKCQGRKDVVCDLVLHLPKVRTQCQVDTDCDINDFCLTEFGECFSAPAVCLPRCNSDLDCPADRFCDRRRGECVDEEPPNGKPFGEACDPDAEVEECLGTCSSSGVCTEKCVLGAYPACGSLDETMASAGCLFGYYEASAAAGDVGACGGLCDCNADCPSRLSCVALEDSGMPFDWRGRPGLCKVPLANETVLSTCGDGGSGGTGAGGAPPTAGAGGEAGAGD